MVYQPYSSSKLKLMVYSSLVGENVMALVGSASWFLVNAGGGRDEANAAKMAFQAFYPTFSTKTLKGIILTGAGPEETWGGQFWRNAFRTVPPFPIYANAAYYDRQAERDVVGPALAAREEGAYGRIPALYGSNPPCRTPPRRWRTVRMDSWAPGR